MEKAQIRSIINQAVSRGANEDQVRQIYARLTRPAAKAQEEPKNPATELLKGLVTQTAMLSQEPTAQDALAGGKMGAAATIAGHAIRAIPHPAAKVVGTLLSSAPVMNVIGGATSEMARGAAERGGAGWGGQLAASLAGGGVPYAAKAVVKPVASAVGGAAQTAARGLGLAGQPAEETSRETVKATELAAKQLRRALEADKISIASLPPDQPIIKQMAEGTANRLEAIATRGGEAQRNLQKYAEGRLTALPGEIGEFLGGAFKEGDTPAMLDALREGARQKYAPLYEKAYNAVPKISDPEIDKAVNRIVNYGDWPRATELAKKIAASEERSFAGEVSPDIIKPEVAAGAKEKAKTWSFRDLDYITRALMDKGFETEGKGKLGGVTTEGALRIKEAGAIRRLMKKANPDFEHVTKTFGDDIAIKEAAEAGKATNLFGTNWKQALNEYKKLPEAAKDAWRLAQAGNLHTEINKAPTATLRKFNTPQFKKVMSEFYSPEELSSLTAALEARAKEAGYLGRALGNSRTTPRAVQQAVDAADSFDTGSGVASLVRSGPYGAAKNTLASFLETKLGNNSVQRKADELIVNALLSTPEQLAALSPSLQNALLKQKPTALRRTGNRLGRAAGAEVAPVTNFLANNNQGQ